MSKKGWDFYKKNPKALNPIWLDKILNFIKVSASIATILGGLIAGYEFFNKHNDKPLEKPQSDKKQKLSTHKSISPQNQLPKHYSRTRPVDNAHLLEIAH
ncbi:hypothetical protein [Mucilaginibacter sp.]|uniref:hypothetical protein n=1 Tax=Mucilaginibacter sp. TaxID=1882438 RepID=UPI0025E0EB84|nr:hypothetical protein [Mucilaginibacter sp.]